MSQHSSAAPRRHSRLVARSPIFCGWIVLATATVGQILTSPGQTYSVSIFIERFIDDLGDLLGSYTLVLTVSALLRLILSVVVLFTPRPQRAVVPAMVAEG